jgi:hypothetical protein
MLKIERISKNKNFLISLSIIFTLEVMLKENSYAYGRDKRVEVAEDITKGHMIYHLTLFNPYSANVENMVSS